MATEANLSVLRPIIRICGLRRRDGNGQLSVLVEFPIADDGGGPFRSRIMVEGLVDKEIFAESALTSLSNALMIIDRIINPPSDHILKLIDASPDDILAVTIEVVI